MPHITLSLHGVPSESLRQSASHPRDSHGELTGDIMATEHLLIKHRTMDNFGETLLWANTSGKGIRDTVLMDFSSNGKHNEDEEEGHEEELLSAAFV